MVTIGIVVDKHHSHIVKNIFRLLTLDELNELASTKKKYNVVPLTEIMLAELKDGELDLEKIFNSSHNEPGKIDATGEVGERKEEDIESKSGKNEFTVYSCAKKCGGYFVRIQLLLSGSQC